MFTITKRVEVAGSHHLRLPYLSKCKNLHGHNWIIEVTVQGPHLNAEGMLIDFTHIKKVTEQLDHANINEVLGDNANPTAEYIAYWVAKQVNKAIADQWQHTSVFTYGPQPIPHEIPSFDIQKEPNVIPSVIRVDVQESEGNIATWQPHSYIQ